MGIKRLNAHASVIQRSLVLTARYLCRIRAFRRTECTALNACPTRWPSYRSPATAGKKQQFKCGCSGSWKEEGGGGGCFLTPDTKVFPVSDGARSRQSTSAACPWKLCSSCPLSTSHSAQVPSPLDVRICGATGEYGRFYKWTLLPDHMISTSKQSHAGCCWCSVGGWFLGGAGQVRESTKGEGGHLHV